MNEYTEHKSLIQAKKKLHTNTYMTIYLNKKYYVLEQSEQKL